MPYVTQDYYLNTFHGEPVINADFLSLLMRAEEIVEEMCMYRLTLSAFHEMEERIQERIRKAVCAQIEYLDANGGSEIDNGIDLQSAGLGKFNYAKASGVSGSTQQSIYAPRAQRILASTGLLYRGGDCY
ncbi:hypothetical protein MCG98_16505 [Ruminococcus sp. OA3]|uniref:hypothetical protein n=1 Tax=Ruminococcus sp. OA3 TaxID=2914164 RepID=UPI001F069C15|nr:hypothetical protein [Ruminococcus sp. OA3]MCH1984169.1 hypothetical protein [Ruminococcus sp. OA3]